MVFNTAAAVVATVTLIVMSSVAGDPVKFDMKTHQGPDMLMLVKIPYDGVSDVGWYVEARNRYEAYSAVTYEKGTIKDADIHSVVVRSLNGVRELNGRPALPASPDKPILKLKAKAADGTDTRILKIHPTVVLDLMEQDIQYLVSETSRLKVSVDGKWRCWATGYYQAYLAKRADFVKHGSVISDLYADVIASANQRVKMNAKANSAAGSSSVAANLKLTAEQRLTGMVEQAGYVLLDNQMEDYLASLASGDIVAYLRQLREEQDDPTCKKP